MMPQDDHQHGLAGKMFRFLGREAWILGKLLLAYFVLGFILVNIDQHFGFSPSCEGSSNDMCGGAMWYLVLMVVLVWGYFIYTAVRVIKFIIGSFRKK